VDRVELGVLAAPAAGMRGHQLIAADDFDLVDRAHDGDVLMGVGGRDGVAVAIEADQ